MGYFRHPEVFLFALAVLGIPSLAIFARAAHAATPTTAEAGPFNTLGNVTYQIEIQFEVRNNNPSFTRDLKVYAPRYLNWTGEGVQDPVPLQNSLLANSTPDGCGSATFNQADNYNNSYDYYFKTLAKNFGFSDRAFTLSMNYTLTTFQVRWDNPGPHSMSEYDSGSTFYALYTQNQPDFIQTLDPHIQGNASAICGGSPDPVEKARLVYSWVRDNLFYETQADDGTDGTGEKGASWALEHRKGDCSEFADLTVALLRAEGVPARKVNGIAIVQPDGSPLDSFAAGATWEYYHSQAGTNLTGHAWVEYFVPGVGWLSCDPTWGQSGADYFNYQDHLHLAAARGSYFGDEVSPPHAPELGEYPVIPHFSITDNYDFYYDLRVKFRVKEMHLPPSPAPLHVLFWLIGAAGVIAVAYVVIARKKQDR